MTRNRLSLIAVATLAIFVETPASAQDSSDLAKQLSNPIASLISVPFQGNYDFDIGPERDGERFTLNVQPVIPISLGEDWNMISRTIVPIIYQDDIFPDAGDQFGLGDTLQSLFFSPKEIGPAGIIWGVGPALLAPTGTEELLSGEKWGAGPTAVVLRQSGGLTYGVLANHVWSFAGDDDREDVSQSFVQPFLSYTTPDAWTFTVNTESSYNWKTEDWSVPINGTVSKLVTIGTQHVSLGAGVKYWAESNDAGPHGVAARFIVTFLFPKR